MKLLIQIRDIASEIKVPCNQRIKRMAQLGLWREIAKPLEKIIQPIMKHPSKIQCLE